MAAPEIKSFKEYILEVGTVANNATTWASMTCGFSQKATTMSAATSTATLPDCDNPENPAWESTGVSSLAAQITGSGVMAIEASPMWDEWFDSGESRPVRRRIPGVGYREGNMVLTSLGESVQLNSDANRVQRSITLKNDGPFTFTSGDPA